MTLLVEILFTMASSLLVPVILLLLILTLGCLLDLGGIVREWQERRRGKVHWHRWCQTVNLDGVSAADSFYESTSYAGLVGVFARRLRSERSGWMIEKHANDLEITAAGRLSRMSFGTRVGPMLGLMGTLIPLGPALIELSRGDLDQMSGNLVVAFSTTVLGLAIGGTCYVLCLIRRQWYAQDLSDIEFVCRILSTTSQASEAGSDSTLLIT